MKKPYLEVSMVALLAAVAHGAQAASLLINGSFESTPQASGTWAVYSSIPGWTTTSGAGIEVRNNVAATFGGGISTIGTVRTAISSDFESAEIARPVSVPNIATAATLTALCSAPASPSMAGSPQNWSTMVKTRNACTRDTMPRTLSLDR